MKRALRASTGQTSNPGFKGRGFEEDFPIKLKTYIISVGNTSMVFSVIVCLGYLNRPELIQETSDYPQPVNRSTIEGRI